MTPDDAFLADIIANPEDDALRLIYSDYLDERGDPRGEFIRVQCELARLPQDGDLRSGERRRDLEARERALLQEYERVWAGPLWGAEFRRGFVEAITASPEQFLEQAAAWFNAAPIRRARFQTAMFRLPWPDPVYPSSAPLLPRMLVCPQLARLSALDFTRNYLGDDGIEALASCPHLGRLASLDLTSNDVGDRGVAALASSGNLSGLLSLKLGGNHVGPAGARALALSRHITRLGCLDFSDNPICDEGVVALAASPNFGHLETLGLARCGVGSAGARALAGSPQLGRLKVLDVRDNPIGNKARQALRVRFGKGQCRLS
jgi:uncharacterized protein (TIGR02996 family)